MNKQKDELSIIYGGQPVKVMTYNSGTDTFFSVHLGTDVIELKLDYIDDIPSWSENGIPSVRAEELGRLIEEVDGR